MRRWNITKKMMHTVFLAFAFCAAMLFAGIPLNAEGFGDEYDGASDYEKANDNLEKFMEQLYGEGQEELAGNIFASYINAETGFRAVLEDDANLIYESDASTLYEQMKELTEYGNVAFLSTNYNTGTAESYARERYRALFGSESGTVFLIDMKNRMIYIFSDGNMYKTLTNSYADSITDNVYKYATNADYYSCASKAFEQELALFRGQHIFQPMKYTSNILLALLLAMLINYFVVRTFANARKPSDEELMKGIFEQQVMNNFHATFTHETREYSPQSSGGGGGGHGGGGGGGGGGHSF